MSAEIIALLESKGLKVMLGSQPSRKIKLKPAIAAELGDANAYWVEYVAQQCLDRLSAPTIVDWFENNHLERVLWYNENIFIEENSVSGFYGRNRLRTNSYSSFLLSLGMIKKLLMQLRRRSVFSDELNELVSILGESNVEEVEKEDYARLSTATKLERLAMLDDVRTRILALVAE